MDKIEARKIALSLRKKKNKHQSSDAVVLEIIASGILSSYTNIGIYYPIGHEIDVMPLLKHYPDKKFYLPITREDIAFIAYGNNEPLTDGPFHTKEPTGAIVERDTIECFIIPCVGIGRNEKRIGYGKGYYDRYLRDYRGVKIGITYDNAIFDCEMDSYDVKLDYIFKG